MTGEAPNPLHVACRSCLAPAGSSCRFDGGLAGFHLARTAEVLGPLVTEVTPEVPRYLVTNPDDTNGGVVTVEVVDPARAVMEAVLAWDDNHADERGIPDAAREALVAAVLRAVGMGGAV